jgi:hypothetical protein
VGRRPGAAGIARRRGSGGGAAGGRRKEGGEGETDRRAPAVSVSVKKKKERGRSGPARGVGSAVWAFWAEREPALVFLFFSFFSFSFLNSISKPNSFQIQIKPFQTFLKNFIDFLETSQATKNHASQQMMHKHLLSLSLLNYI